ncbi:MAG: F0F1 ATP synthase subunit A [Bacteroidetes bacterium]|nr:F0F1 ATP synthase subunit A [Bacteroidota bacterium]
MVEAVNKKVGSKHPDSYREAAGKTFLVQLGIVFLFVLSGFFAFANEEVAVDSAATHTEATEEHAEKSEKFSPGKLIIGHIADAHDWHIYGSEEHPVSIPLPIIIYNKDKGFTSFMSSRFEHGHATYEGYKLEEGKIISEEGSAFYDFSITKNVLAIFIAAGLMLFIFIGVAKTYARTPDQAPSGFQNAIEPMILFVRDDIAKSAIGEKHYAKFMPYLLTIFFFIWISNIMGLIPVFPGGANVTGNIAVPLVLATCTLLITLFYGNKNYWTHILAMPGVPKAILIILTPLEVLGIFLKPFVLMIRLFANIMAGHIVVLVFFCLIFVAGAASTGAGFGAAVPAIAFTIFINGIELLVGFLQAFVFTFLSAVYFGMATAEPEHH